MALQSDDQSVLRLTRPTQAQFEKAVRTGRLLVIDGLARELSKDNSYSLDYLQAVIGERRVEVDRRAVRNLPQDPEARPNFERVRFGEFRRRIATEAFDGPRTYLQDDVNNFPSLRASYALPSYLRQVAITRTKLWVSGRGLVTPLHYDPVEVVHWMMEGSKHWCLARPGLTNFYPHGMRTKAPMFSKVDPVAPDLTRYPRWAKVRPIELDLQAGQLLYIPAFYWHHVESTADYNVSINFIWVAAARKIARYLPEFTHSLPFVVWQAKRIAQAKAALAQH